MDRFPGFFSLKNRKRLLFILFLLAPSCIFVSRLPPEGQVKDKESDNSSRYITNMHPVPGCPMAGQTEISTPLA